MSLPSAADLVARYLKTGGYTETLKAFILEAGLEPDAGSTSGDGITIDQILQEKKTFDLSLNFEKLGVQDKNRPWLIPAPSEAKTIESIPTKSNILSTALLKCRLASTPEPKAYFAATTADRRLHLFDPEAPSLPLIRSYSSFIDSPILDALMVEGKYLLTGSMSGRLLLYCPETDQVLDERRDQSKYIVKLAVQSFQGSTIIATAGWDSKVFLYRLSTDDASRPRLGNPIASVTLSSVPETLLFVKSPETSRPILLLSRRDSTFLHYYSVPSLSSDHAELRLLGRQNLAPHSNAWVAFTPSDIQLSPTDPSLVAIATSSTPHMKLLIVRLLIPPEERLEPSAEHPVTQASQARDELLIQDREEASIAVNINTMAPQTAYSTPRLTWRPDGSGVYVSSDDGVVRGFEASTGKHMATLSAHEPGSKIRCLWAGQLETNTPSTSPQNEVLLTGAFDQRLILWSTSQ
ncbi:hypothetical protein DM02DRAFT_532259 [Periconia macrospinosa]|uniref:Uncharacterized protein n=1 Tax=Periconia macrospinosa TaxID=97972 RepID=A0A2V1DJ92_9PLEO|nr:hypothetical protein DM02DRAFT_532259 [Periconia macrospinosa]